MKINTSALIQAPLNQKKATASGPLSKPQPSVSSLSQDHSTLSIQTQQGLMEAGAGALMAGVMAGSSALLIRSMGQMSSGSLAGALIGGGAAAIVTGVSLGTVTDGKMLADKSTVALGGALGGAALGYMSSQSLTGAAAGALMGASVAGLGAYLGQ